MLLQSLITDDSKVTIHIDDTDNNFVFKGTLWAGSVCEIPDEAYYYKEVQEAINQGFAKLVGEPPAARAAKSSPMARRLKNISPHKVCLDCIKNYAEANGGVVEVPEHMMGHAEVRSAMRSTPDYPHGMLVDESVPLKQLSPEEKAIASARGKKQVAVKKNGAMKAKKIGAHDDMIVDTNANEPQSLFSESQVRIPGEKSVAAVPVDVDTSEMEETGSVMATPKPKDVVNPDELFDRWWSDDEGK